MRITTRLLDIWRNLTTGFDAEDFASNFARDLDRAKKANEAALERLFQEKRRARMHDINRPSPSQRIH